MPLFRRDDRRPDSSAPVVTGVVREAVPAVPASRAPGAGGTRIGPGLVVVGRVAGSGTVEIAGRVEGGVEVDGTVVVSRQGSVIGDAAGREVRIEGHVEGRLLASERATIAASGSVEGDVEAPRVVIAEGASLKGRVSMGGEARERAAGAGERP